MAKPLDVTGHRYGRLLVTSRGEDKIGATGIRSRRWTCICDCGNETLVVLGQLRSGKTTSCGCFHKEDMANRFRKHGMSRTSIYLVWAGMKNRCYNTKDAKFYLWGGRGIKICSQWLNDFEAFAAYMGPRPKGHSIDRINVNGDYEPGNVRWATAYEQRMNQRPRKPKD